MSTLSSFVMVELKLNEKFELFERRVPFNVWVRDRTIFYTTTVTQLYNN
jgi:hypothetical protein